MKLYKDIWYPNDKQEISDRTIVEILTSKERTSIQQGYYDTYWKRQQSCSFAINYAWKEGDRSPILRGFEFEGKLYEIDINCKTILVQPKIGQLFYDEDKILIRPLRQDGLSDDPKWAPDAPRRVGIGPQIRSRIS